MAKPELTRNAMRWTEAKFNAFIKGLLRKGTQRWPPKTEALKNARTSKGIYTCNECKQQVPVTVKVGDKRVRNVFVDHLVPVVDPTTGFMSWDEYINRMFCEPDNFQVLCASCHTEKTAEERTISLERTRAKKEKQNDEV